MAPSPNFDRAPMMIYWETTRACDLACQHCRAEAIARRDPRELSTAEGMRLLESLATFGEPMPHLVFTGGDPLRRPDIYPLIEHAVHLGLTASVTPSGTPAATKAAIERLLDAGTHTIAFSLDGSTVEKHDAIRGVNGSFDYTVSAIRAALTAGANVQVNSLASAETAADLPAIEQLVRDLGAQRWAVFFLIQVGRGAVLSQMSPGEAESLLNWLYDRSRLPGLVIKTTEAHHFRRVAIQRQPTGTRPEGAVAAIRRSWNIRDGAGIMFISHTGEVYPSGFLPLSAGNVRDSDPVTIYRDSATFRQLRDPTQFKGKCGECEFRVICGGSRARAFAATGDPLESDPLCVYQPATRGATIERARPLTAEVR